MEKSDFKARMIEYINKGIYYGENDDELEEFYELMDEMEEAAIKDSSIYELLTDCYMQVRNYKQAKACFEKVYDSKNKKHIKRMHDLEHMKSKPLTRPSKRAEKLPRFTYAGDKAIKEMFISSKKGCCICGKKNPLYIGTAYKNDGEQISFSDKSANINYANNSDDINRSDNEERFCAECIADGKAAQVKEIVFQPLIMKEQRKIREDKREILLQRTPGCSEEFWQISEEVWAICCDDYCRYEGKNRNEEYIFSCLHCKNKYKYSETMSVT